MQIVAENELQLLHLKLSNSELELFILEYIHSFSSVTYYYNYCVPKLESVLARARMATRLIFKESGCLYLCRVSLEDGGRE